MKSIAWLKPDHEFVGDVLGIEQVFASVGLSVDPSPNESLEDQLVVDRHLELLPENRVMTRRAWYSRLQEKRSAFQLVQFQHLGKICRPSESLPYLVSNTVKRNMMVALDPLLPRPLLV